ncbi:hypothetical protein [Sanguibacter suaedae]|uniref:Uncharacterized protein n=1 Tax=Sanguibacter suaedae TaxID=2795737 RepID=A0A934I3N8_9MICO|nr:hypothetical protein [Sanguibacter suaedae]MBI9113641.1 hypothetical protein [Sanguibacter suaedae]
MQSGRLGDDEADRRQVCRGMDGAVTFSYRVTLLAGAPPVPRGPRKGPEPHWEDHPGLVRAGASGDGA